MLRTSTLRLFSSIHDRSPWLFAQPNTFAIRARSLDQGLRTTLHLEARDIAYMYVGRARSLSPTPQPLLEWFQGLAYGSDVKVNVEMRQPCADGQVIKDSVSNVDGPNGKGFDVDRASHESLDKLALRRALVKE